MIEAKTEAKTSVDAAPEILWSKLAFIKAWMDSDCRPDCDLRDEGCANGNRTKAFLQLKSLWVSKAKDLIQKALAEDLKMEECEIRENGLLIGVAAYFLARGMSAGIAMTNAKADVEGLRGALESEVAGKLAKFAEACEKEGKVN